MILNVSFSYSSRSLLPVHPSIPPRGVRRVSIGYRLGVDWRKVEPTEIHYRIKSNYKSRFDHTQTAREEQRLFLRLGELPFLFLILFPFIASNIPSREGRELSISTKAFEDSTALAIVPFACACTYYYRKGRLEFKSALWIGEEPISDPRRAIKSPF